MEQGPDPGVLDKAISLLQWTAQELASASGSDARQAAFSLPSSFGTFHSDSLDAALRELESMQRSTSTERLHRSCSLLLRLAICSAVAVPHMADVCDGPSSEASLLQCCPFITCQQHRQLCC